MATGVLIQVTDHDALPLQGITPNLPNDLQWQSGTPEKIYDPGLGEPEHGSSEQKRQVDPLGTDRASGYRVPMYFDDYYNQVWVLPTSLDFGAIGSESSKQFLVWNAYWRQPTILTSIGVENGDGTRLDGPSTPKVFKPLEYAYYTVTVAADGPATINTVYTLNFSDGMVTRFPITGSRAKLWPFTVNWNNSYRVSYEFRTEVLTTWAGREQRIAHRMTPRKKVTFSTLVHNRDLTRMNNLMWSWQTRAFVLPQITHRTHSSAPMDALAESMDVSAPVPSWLVAGTTVILDHFGQQEIKVVDRVENLSVYFKAASTTPWPEGTTLYYALTGFFDPQVSTPRKTSTTSSFELTLNVVPLSEIYPDPPAATQTIGGREIFDKRPNWADDVPVTFQHEIQELDYGHGPVARFAPIAFGTMLRSHTYLARDLAEADAMVDLFRRTYGQQGEFYVPTWEHDLFPKEVLQASTQTMRIAGRDIYDAYQGSTVNRGLAIRFKDGSMLYKLVLSIDAISDADGDDSVITITETWGQRIDPDDVEYVSWLLLFRFASDTLTIEFLTDRVAQFQSTLRSLENLTPEV